MRFWIRFYDSIGHLNNLGIVLESCTIWLVFHIIQEAKDWNIAGVWETYRDFSLFFFGGLVVRIKPSQNVILWWGSIWQNECPQNTDTVFVCVFDEFN